MEFPTSVVSFQPHVSMTIIFAVCHIVFPQVPIFAAVDAAFLRHLTLMIKPCLFLPGEFIVHKGDMGLGMFFLYHGTVSVTIYIIQAYVL